LPSLGHVSNFRVVVGVEHFNLAPRLGLDELARDKQLVLQLHIYDPCLKTDSAKSGAQRSAACRSSRAPNWKSTFQKGKCGFKSRCLTAFNSTI
jgi:hypothetical protein